MFCEMLMKGAVNMVELIFADHECLLYTSEAWQALTQHKLMFLSEKVILQYVGYVKTHMKIIRSKKHSGTPRERKIFYNVSRSIVLCGHPLHLEEGSSALPFFFLSSSEGAGHFKTNLIAFLCCASLK